MQKEIGANVKSARIRMGLTQAELAELIGASVGYISKIERGAATCVCAKQGKPQRYQYRLYGDQRFLGAADGGNRCARAVPCFRTVRELPAHLYGSP